MATLGQRSVGASAIRLIRRRMSVVGRHCVPEGAPCSGDAAIARQYKTKTLPSKKRPLTWPCRAKDRGVRLFGFCALVCFGGAGVFDKQNDAADACELYDGCSDVDDFRSGDVDGGGDGGGCGEEEWW